jgi:branched-chain amino acid transport system substrate-binding protein
MILRPYDLRRGVTIVALLGVLVALVLGSPGAGADKRPIVVGYLVPLTGTTAQSGKNASRGFNLGLKLFAANHVLDGHKLVLKYADTQGNPTVSLSNVRELVEHEHADVIEGPLNSTELPGDHAYLAPRGIPTPRL